MISKCQFMMLSAIISILFCLMGCEGDHFKPRPITDNNDWVKNHQEIHAGFHYLPDQGKASISIRADTVFSQMRNMKDSLLFSNRYVMTKEDYSKLDSLLFYLDHIKAGEYFKRPVIDGTKMWVTYGTKSITCDNCLHDYVLAATGLKLAKPPRNMRTMKEAIGIIASFMNQANTIKKDSWKRIDIITNIMQLTDTTQKYKVQKDSSIQAIEVHKN